MARAQDRFANLLMAKVTMSGVDTISFTEILTGVSLGAGIGMLIDQIDYFFDKAANAELVSGSDAARVGWTVSDSLTTLKFDDRSVIHLVEISPVFTTSGFEQEVSPKPFQFFPPIIRAAPRLFLAADTDGFAAAGTFYARMYFRYIELSTQEYLELAETGLVIG